MGSSNGNKKNIGLIVVVVFVALSVAMLLSEQKNGSIGSENSVLTGMVTGGGGNNTTAPPPVYLGKPGVCIPGTGTDSTACFGSAVVASGDYSFAAGYETLASGEASTATGYQTLASGRFSTATGYGSQASGTHSTAMGYGSQASGGASTAMGSITEASGGFSTAMGYSTEASGTYSTAMGGRTEASGDLSTAMGYYATASHDESFVIGLSSTTSDNCESSADEEFRVCADDAVFETNLGEYSINDLVTMIDALLLVFNEQDARVDELEAELCSMDSSYAFC